MRSPNILIRKGFTFIEMMIVLGIIAILATFGIIAGLDLYARYNFRSEVDKAMAMLGRARSEAMNNISELPHGVYFADSQDLILFAGKDFAHRNSSYDLKIEKAKTASYTGASEAIFSQLAGTTTAATVVVGDGIRSATIIINYEGGIDY